MIEGVNIRLYATFVRNRLLKTKLFSFLSICACHVPIKKPILPTINNVHYDGDSIIWVTILRLVNGVLQTIK